MNKPTFPRLPRVLALSRASDTSVKNMDHNEVAPPAADWLPRTVRRFCRRLRALHRAVFVLPTDHEEVEARVLGAGAFTGQYGFMVVMASAIATLGLLLSSPAVIIGAMLISPLMGPIMLFGFSLALLDFAAFRRSAVALVIGVGLALAISYVIVILSPLTQATPEILARTRPNLFDLLVAVFSGLAGAYAVLNKKGETIVGVAIATALMPPLAVVGYGLASRAPQVAAGAWFLFMTNLLAIALSATALAVLYGFAARQSRTKNVWRVALMIVVFGGLSIPLGISLKKISYEARVSRMTRGVLEDGLTGMARLGELVVRFTPDGVKVDAVVLTKSYDAGAEHRLQTALERAVGQSVVLDLDQVLVDQDRPLDPAEFLRLAETSLTAPLQAQIAQMTRRDQLTEDFRAVAPFKVGAVEVDTQSRVATLYAGPTKYIDFAAYREIETELATRYPTWRLQVIPPPQALPPVPFDLGSASLNPAARDILDTIHWTLDRWGLKQVSATGYASTAGPRRLNRTLTLARAQNVADYLRVHGIEALVIGEFWQRDQDAVERLYGLSRFHRVDVALRPIEVEPLQRGSVGSTAEIRPSPSRDAAVSTTSTSSSR